ncbi:DUF6146 family protein [Draconibacterium sp. IB214405]|uniref:DUF6146 family protein n=1 Tax=Draconibacterium sp. IB214405 TaxID=3097352 RepID=UPI002A121187|nr:DUF6146 family protein [Draconibacterium sp. IB214405]MDX8341332.1 DUF6146 family protein [Draconibacterium sp. IB214405]
MRKTKFILLCVLFGMAVLVVACSGSKNVAQGEKKSVEVTGEDSVEYDVETFNANFDVWYQRQNTPASYRSQSYYESWNKQYVSAWNAKCASPSPSWNFEPVVGYDVNEDYGFEMNHKLFYYFMYVENVLKKKIIPGGPKPVFH